MTKKRHNAAAVRGSGNAPGRSPSETGKRGEVVRLLTLTDATCEAIAQVVGCDSSYVYRVQAELGAGPNKDAAKLAEVLERLRSVETRLARLEGMPEDPVSRRRLLQRLNGGLARPPATG